ncbi:hypothetical protein SBBP2_1760003 [Burkholderiales bacterium]|nr:hypothetical protein SBBP2_1760003 [Burkholderiales bacterium]
MPLVRVLGRFAPPQWQKRHPVFLPVAARAGRPFDIASRILRTLGGLAQLVRAEES